MHYYVLFQTFLSILISVTSESDGEDTLEFVSIVFRHGNRAPLVHYKNDPHKHSFPDGVGQLTKRGKQNMYLKGTILRRLYGHILGENYREDDLYCTSTNLDRTHMTAQLVLAGIYPPSDHYHQFEQHLAWQPIPVHEDSPDKSFIFGHGYLCPRYSNLFYEEINKTTATLMERNQIQTLFTYCERHCGEKVKTVADLGLLVDALKSEVADGLQLPKWASEYYESEMLRILDILMNVIVKTTEQKRLITGPLLKQIVENMVEKAQGKLKPNRKVVLYSGHDFSILGLLGSITKSSKLMPQPDFGASLAFEMYRRGDVNEPQYYVRVKYLKSFNNEEPEEIEIADCAYPCMLDDFKEVTQYVIPDNWDLECSLTRIPDQTCTSNIGG